MTESVKENLLVAFRYLMKPLVRLAIKNGIFFAEFSEALKAAYIDVAVVKIKSAGDEVSEDRISLMTNVSAREINSLLKSNPNEGFPFAVRRELPLPNLLTAWYTDPTYAGPYGVC